MTTLILQFLFLAALIVVAGTFLASFSDQLGEVLGLGSSMAGLVLLASATSLPELLIGCTSAFIPAPDLTVGDVLGSSLFNLLILAVLDLTHRTRGRMFSPAAASHALSGVSSILLTSVVLIALLVDIPWPIPRIGPGSIAIAVTYLLAMRLIFFDQRVQLAAAESEPARTHARSTRATVLGYAGCTLVILVAAPLLAFTADAISKQSGLDGRFIGTVFVALTTSLPEVSSTRAAVKMGSYDLAVGNVLGSNSFNMLILVVVDMLYAEPLLMTVSDAHALTAACGILVTAVATLGFLYRAEKRFWGIEPDALLVMLLIFGSLTLTYFTQG